MAAAVSSSVSKASSIGRVSAMDSNCFCSAEFTSGEELVIGALAGTFELLIMALLLPGATQPAVRQAHRRAKNLNLIPRLYDLFIV